MSEIDPWIKASVEQQKRAERAEAQLRSSAEEIGRLRAALEQIVRLEFLSGHGAREIARTALDALPKRYRVVALMAGELTRLVVSDGDDPYSTEDRRRAETVLAEVSTLHPAYISPRIEEIKAALATPTTETPE